MCGRLAMYCFLFPSTPSPAIQGTEVIAEWGLARQTSYDDGNPPPCNRVGHLGHSRLVTMVVYNPDPGTPPRQRGRQESSSRGTQWSILASWIRLGPDGRNGGGGLGPESMAGGSKSFVARREQSDKVKPLPCTLTEVFHAMAAWRPNPTKLAGITFQTGMLVNNVRSPVISIMIIQSGLGPWTFVPTSFLPSQPLLATITSVYHRCRCSSIVSSSPVRSRPSPQVQGQSPNRQCTMPICTLPMRVCGCVGSACVSV